MVVVKLAAMVAALFPPRRTQREGEGKEIE
jgi:hypothetical protein